MSSDVYGRGYPLARVDAPQAIAQERMIVHRGPITFRCNW